MIEMTVEAYEERCRRIRQHWRALGVDERQRRKRLMWEAGQLFGNLVTRYAKFARLDRCEARRSIETIRHANQRLRRRERAYFGE